MMTNQALMTKKVNSSYELQSKNIQNCQMMCNRVEMLNYLPKNAVVVEVGTREGHFAQHIVNICQPKMLYLLDNNFAKFERENFLKGIYNGTIKPINGDSAHSLNRFPDRFFDWMYIDGDHRYKGVLRDIRAAVKKVKEDGILVFNDYIHWTRRGEDYGVIRAVNELCLEQGWEVIFLALQKGGYNDIAIRKMK